MSFYHYDYDDVSKYHLRIDIAESYSSLDSTDTRTVYAFFFSIEFLEVFDMFGGIF